MSQCTFLSTFDKQVECFNDCAFNNQENEEECPFKNISFNKNKKINEYFKYALLDIDELDGLDEADKTFIENEDEYEESF